MVTLLLHAKSTMAKTVISRDTENEIKIETHFYKKKKWNLRPECRIFLNDLKNYQF
jgi:hypothetical protein